MTKPTDQYREKAEEIAKRYTVEGTGYADRLYQLAYAIEQALSSRDAEVREVLEGLRFRHGCWCELPPNAGSPHHTNECDDTRALWQKVGDPL